MPAEYKIGDLVIVASQETVQYTITSVYGGGAHALCAYSQNGVTKELSIPTIALRKVQQPVVYPSVRQSQLSHARYAGDFGR